MRIPHAALGILLVAGLTATCPAADGISDDSDLEGTIARRIADLDSPRFEVREKAVDDLKGFGFAAIEPVSAAAERGGLEVSVRAVEVLETIYSLAGKSLSGPLDDNPQTAAGVPPLKDVELLELPADGSEPREITPRPEPTAEPPFTTWLRKYGREPRPATQTTDAAEAALEQLTLSTNRSVASRAAAALERNYDIREKRALAEIQKLGGAIDYMPQAGRARGVPQAAPNPATQSDFYFIRIDRDWTGGDQGLEQIKRLSKLNTLYVIDGADISTEAIEGLEAALPDLNVQFRGEAFLGISGHPNQVGGLGCLIDKVSEGGAAERAGIRPGDMIINFGGQRVTDFVTLIKVIRTHKAGDKVAVQLRRGGRIEELEVELDRWSATGQN